MALKICDLTTLYIDGGEGGVNTYLREKASYLDRFVGEFQHTMIVPAGRSETRRLAGSTVHAIQSPRFFRNPQHRVIFNRRAVAEILRRERPDVIEVDCASRLALVAARALGRNHPPIVGYYHVHLPTFYARALALPLGRGAAAVAEEIAWRFLHHCIRPCDRIVVPSRDMYERLEARGIAPLVHIPLGVNLDLFHPVANGHNGNGAIRANGKTTILFVGRLSKEKDIPVLFAAFDRLSAQGDFRLRVAGDGPLRPEVEEYARSRSGVEYLGLCHYGSDLARLYREADVLAVPSASETFGLIILEALASGIPVVAVRSGGPVHLLRSDLGALARPGDPGDFAEKIERVIRERRRAEPYRDYVANQYSWERTFDRMVALYRELARR